MIDSIIENPMRSEIINILPDLCRIYPDHSRTDGPTGNNLPGEISKAAEKNI